MYVATVPEDVLSEDVVIVVTAVVIVVGPGPDRPMTMTLNTAATTMAVTTRATGIVPIALRRGVILRTVQTDACIVLSNRTRLLRCWSASHEANRSVSAGPRGNSGL